jgi:hypothetical protein
MGAMREKCSPPGPKPKYCAVYQYIYGCARSPRWALYVNLTPNGPRSLFPLIQPERQSDVPLGSVMALLTP